MNELRIDNEKVEWREVDHEVIALEREGAAYLSVNRSGTLLWRALSEGVSEKGLAQLLVTKYGLELETAQSDVAHFVTELRRQGLLER
jgi:hypothetical protein